MFKWLLVKSPNDASAVLLGKALSNLKIENSRATVAHDKATFFLRLRLTLEEMVIYRYRKFKTSRHFKELIF